MSGTYSQIYIQVVFAVKGREILISNRWKDELHKYIAGIIQAKEQKSCVIGGNHRKRGKSTEKCLKTGENRLFVSININKI